MNGFRLCELPCLAAALTLAAAAAGCRHVPDARGNAAPPGSVSGAEAAPAPTPCAATLAVPAPMLKLPRTDGPKLASKGDKVDIAQIHTVNRPLQDVGVWREAGSGWSVLTLQFGSERAHSLAVRLHDVKLPKGAALWLCSVDGKRRAGPFTPKENGELWSDPITASQGRVELWSPSAQREKVSALLADVYSGYR
ncbi:MAG: hypothetical protein QM661_07285 [Solimonas sp.]